MAKKSARAIEERTPQQHFDAIAIDARLRLDRGQFAGFSNWFMDELQAAPQFPRLGNTIRIAGNHAEGRKDLDGYDVRSALEMWMQGIDAMIPDDPPEAVDADAG